MSTIRTLLIAEDEELIRKLLQHTLKSQGFEVLTARDGASALALAREHGGAIDLLVTDINMPDMKGGVLAKKLQEMYPDLKVLIMSGSVGMDSLNCPEGLQAPHFLAKPFTLDRLLSAVEQFV